MMYPERRDNRWPRRQRVLAACVIVPLAYLTTWLGGWHTYAVQLDASAQAKYQKDAAFFAEAYPGVRDEDLPVFAQLRKGGPITGVDWAFPILPGVLVVEDFQNLGRLNQRGGVKILLYYGAGTLVLVNFGWIT